MKAKLYLTGLEGIGVGSLWPSIDFLKQMQQVVATICVDGPIHMVRQQLQMLLRSHAFELKC